MEKYFVIRNSDGDTTVHAFSKDSLLEMIKDGEYENVLKELPESPDTNYWGEGVIIIKGSLVSPKAIKVVKEYDID